MPPLFRVLALSALIAGCSAQPQAPVEPEMDTVTEADGAGEFIPAPVEAAPKP